MKFVNHVNYVSDAMKVSSARPAHRQYADGLMESGKLVAAGPFSDGSGALLIYETDSYDEARDLILNDPFAIEGAIQSYDIRPWTILGVNLALLPAEISRLPVVSAGQ